MISNKKRPAKIPAGRIFYFFFAKMTSLLNR